MTRLILVTLLLGLSEGPVFAEWREVGTSNANGGFTIYANPESLRRNGNVVRWWELFDYKTIQDWGGLSYLSSKKLSEYECVEESQRMRAWTHYTGKMASGSVIYSHSGESKWEPVIPDSIGQGLWKIACDKP